MRTYLLVLVSALVCGAHSAEAADLDCKIIQSQDAISLKSPDIAPVSLVFYDPDMVQPPADKHTSVTAFHEHIGKHAAIVGGSCLVKAHASLLGTQAYWTKGIIGGWVCYLKPDNNSESVSAVLSVEVCRVKENGAPK